ncbi:MAG: YjjG family noncanonical pyrimidine nucleotidase [Cellulosilyticaceae bacterium]
MKKYDLILLDIDGTIMDFEKAQDEAFKTMMTTHLLPYSEANYDSYKRINKGLWAALERGEIKKQALKSERFRLFLDAIGETRDIETVTRDYEDALGMGVYFIEGAEAICKQLSEACTVAVVTNGISKIQHSRLEKSGLKPFFHELFISEEVGHEKPSAAFFEAVFKKLGGYDKTRVLIVGDSLSADMRGGEVAGIHTCWFNPTAMARPEGYVIQHEIQSLKQLEEIVGLK